MKKASNSLVEQALFEAANPRLGRCYELSGRHVSGHRSATLIHGKLVNPFAQGHAELEHAWVEDGDEVYDPVMDKTWPKDAYYGLFKATAHKRYSGSEVLQQSLKHQHWGPWD